MVSGVEILDHLVFFLLLIVIIPLLAVVSSLIWRCGFLAVNLLLHILVFLGLPFLLWGGIANVLTPGGYELGVMLLVAWLVVSVAWIFSEEFAENRNLIIMSQFVVGLLALLALPMSSTVFFAAVVFSLSGMLGEMTIDYDI